MEKGRKMLGIVNIYLLWGGWTDLKKKKVSNQYLWMGGIAGIIYNLMEMVTGEFVWKEQFMAFLPGFLILAIAKITNEKIGYGDGWVILRSFLNLGEIYVMLQLAVIMAAVLAVGLLCTKKAGKEYRIPFLPFLWMAYVLEWGIKYV